MNSIISKTILLSLFIPNTIAFAGLDKAVLKAIVDNDGDRLRAALATCEDIDAQGASGSALDYAVRRGFPLLVEILLEKGAQIEVPGGVSALSLARELAARNDLGETAEKMRSRAEVLRILEVQVQATRDAEIVIYLRQRRAAERAAAEQAAAAVPAVEALEDRQLPQPSGSWLRRSLSKFVQPHNS